MTKCTFHKFGPSGTVQKFDGLCVLPLNIINEKIYVFLWFWFVILAIVTGIQVMELFFSCSSYLMDNHSQRALPYDDVHTQSHRRHHLGQPHLHPHPWLMLRWCTEL